MNNYPDPITEYSAWKHHLKDLAREAQQEQRVHEARGPQPERPVLYQIAAYRIAAGRMAASRIVRAGLRRYPPQFRQRLAVFARTRWIFRRV